jgi:hypothetical protein
LVPTSVWYKFWCHEVYMFFFKKQTLKGGSVMSSDPLQRFNRYLQPMGLLLRIFCLACRPAMWYIRLHCAFFAFRRGPLPLEQLRVVESNYNQYREAYDRY